jgi:hypothetical protein
MFALACVRADPGRYQSWWLATQIGWAQFVKEHRGPVANAESIVDSGWMGAYRTGLHFAAGQAGLSGVLISLTCGISLTGNLHSG